MSFSTILHKRNSNQGVVPSSGALSAGEIAINTADGKLFTKTIDNSIKTFLNSEQQPYVLDTSLSSVEFQYGNNTATGALAQVLGGVDNNVSGAGSTVLNGSDNDIEADYGFIGNGSNNTILTGGDFGAILGGQNNVLNHPESFILGSNITSHLSGITYVNSLSSLGKIYGDGSQLTGIVAGGDTEATTLVRSSSANWTNSYTYISATSANLVLTSDSRLSDSRTPSGNAGGDLTGTYPNPTIKSSVSLAGTPTAPTAAAGTNTQQIATTEFVINNAGDRYLTTSNTSNTINKVNNKTFYVASSGLAYTATQDITIVYSQDPLNHHMHCTVVSFSGYELVVQVQQTTGSGTYSDWTINVGGYTTQAGVLLQSNNLSDISSPHAALTNLGGVSATRQIIAGTGLAGGGDLTADRTISVVFGNTSSTAVSGNDPRLSDSRTPLAHKASHAIGGSDVLTPADIGAVSNTYFGSVSGNWDSVYSNVQANSATTWNYQGTDIKALTGNWQNTFTTVQSNSATTWTKSKTIAFFTALNNEPPATNFATLDTRNSHPVLDFDTTTQETAIFRNIIPEGVNLSNGLNVIAQWAATSATTGTVGWDVAFERITSNGIDIDADSFGTARTITAITVPSTAGVTLTSSCSFTQAQLPSGLTNGDMYRMRIRRDVANDTASGDAELLGVEVRLI